MFSYLTGKVNLEQTGWPSYAISEVSYPKMASVLTEQDAGHHTRDMNVHFSPEIQAKLDRAAAEQGRKADSLIHSSPQP
jgi:hypothetical protein